MWINGSQPNFDDILKQLSLSIARRRLFSLTLMLRFINFVVIKDVIYTEKSLTLVVPLANVPVHVPLRMHETSRST